MRYDHVFAVPKDVQHSLSLHCHAAEFWIVDMLSLTDLHWQISHFNIKQAILVVTMWVNFLC